MLYKDALKYLFEAKKETANKPNLSLFKKAGDPQRFFKSVHIAGTNGKGSCAYKIAKGLELNGLKTGLYTSPHISSFRERIQINGSMISEEEIVKHLERGIPGSFFELTTLIAFLHFAQERVDWAVLETGIGGRLDATNIVLPELSIITSIALDHMEILGDNIEAIAQEKGGIIKPHTPILIGPRVPLSVISPIAAQLKASLTRVEGTFASFDEENSAIAAKALEMLQVPPSIALQAISQRPPCRLEKVSSPLYPFSVILDAAHNPDGLNALFNAVKGKYPVIVGLSKSKDLKGALQILSERASCLYLVQAKNSRAAPPSALSQILDQFASCPYTICPSVKAALDQVPSSPIICGTFFILSEARDALGIYFPKDLLD